MTKGRITSACILAVTILIVSGSMAYAGRAFSRRSVSMAPTAIFGRPQSGAAWGSEITVTVTLSDWAGRAYTAQTLISQGETEGSYILEGIPPGTNYIITAHARDNIGQEASLRAILPEVNVGHNYTGIIIDQDSELMMGVLETIVDNLGIEFRNLPAVTVYGVQQALIGGISAQSVIALYSTGTIAGEVRDITAGLPIPGALVSIPGHGLTCQSSAEGVYEMLGVPARISELTASKSGYRPYVRTGFQVQVGQVTELTLRMQPADYTFSASGAVRDSEGLGIGGVRIDISGGFSPVYTDINGAWAVSGLHGIVELTPHKTGYVFEPGLISIEESRSNVDFTGTMMLGSTKISGRATLRNAHDPIQGLGSLARTIGPRAPEPAYSDPMSILPEQVIVMPKTGAMIAQATITALGAQVVSVSYRGGFQVIKPTTGQSVDALVEALRGMPWVGYAGPDHIVTATSMPNDPLYALQWNYRAVNLPWAWSVHKGHEREVVVAVIDSGVRGTHPDLAGKLVAGWDFVDGDSDPTDMPAAGRMSHGTHVAGIIAAATNNGQGVAGVSWGARIMPVRVLGPTGSGTESKLIEGIYWAADNGADVINMSLSLGTFYQLTPVLDAALNYARTRGVVMVGAAGNTRASFVHYPARHPAVIAVGATGRFNEIASYTNTGDDTVVTAPGGNRDYRGLDEDRVLSTYYSSFTGDSYGWSQGTSMAAPHVSGLVALIMSGLGISDPDTISDLIALTSVDLGTPGFDRSYGHGLINAHGAVSQATMDRAVFAVVESNGRLASRVAAGNRDRTYEITGAVAGLHWVLAWLDLPPYGSMDDHDYVGAYQIIVPSTGIVQPPILGLDILAHAPQSTKDLVRSVDIKQLRR